MVVQEARLTGTSRSGPLEAVGFVVAGGRSTRMARDKALLPWGTATLLDHAIARLRECCGTVRILSGPEARYVDRGLPVDPDDVPDAGPLGGLATGLARLTEAPGLFLAVDVPGVPVALLKHLLALAQDWDAVVPVSPDGPQPVSAVYRASCLAPVRQHLAAGDRTMTCFWPDIRVRKVDETELAAFGKPCDLFVNVNTPEDYRRSRAEAP